MRTRFIVCLIFVCGTSVLAQRSATPTPTVQGPSPGSLGRPIWLMGCIPVHDVTTNKLTWLDKKGGYHTATGTKKSYRGRPVNFVGGFIPTTNIAAQAGSLDETYTAMMTESNRGTGIPKPNRSKPQAARGWTLTGSCQP